MLSELIFHYKSWYTGLKRNAMAYLHHVKANAALIKKIHQILWTWYVRNERPLPWTGEKDPYKIWLSEIILHQTNVERGTPYYHRFVKTFPNVLSLAQADRKLVQKMWEGLGYNTRAINLHKAAQQVVSEGGVFPDTYAGLLALPGVGSYTAAAIASFAYGLPHAVCDVNVIRILSRWFGIKGSVTSTKTQKQITHLAQLLCDTKHPGEWNQCMMNFGALQCTARHPQCSTCPMRALCHAYFTGTPEKFPHKSKKQSRKQIYLHYFIIRDIHNRILLRQRSHDEIWPGLFEFPAIQEEKPLSVHELKERFSSLKKQWNTTKATSLMEVAHLKQVLTHRQVHGIFYECTGLKLQKGITGFILTDQKDISTFALPGIIRTFIQKGHLLII